MGNIVHDVDADGILDLIVATAEGVEIRSGDNVETWRFDRNDWRLKAASGKKAESNGDAVSDTVGVEMFKISGRESPAFLNIRTAKPPYYFAFRLRGPKGDFALCLSRNLEDAGFVIRRNGGKLIFGEGGKGREFVVRPGMSKSKKGVIELFNLRKSILVFIDGLPAGKVKKKNIEEIGGIPGIDINRGAAFGNGPARPICVTRRRGSPPCRWKEPGRMRDSWSRTLAGA